MELTNRTATITIQDPKKTGDGKIVHIISIFDAKAMSKYQRRLTSTTKIRKGKVDMREVDVKLDVWKNQIQDVKGYTIGGKNVTEMNDWKDRVADLAPDHCVIVVNAIDSAFASGEDDDDEDDIETPPLQKKPSPDASDDGSKPNTSS